MSKNNEEKTEQASPKAEKKTSIFRKQVLDRVSSPEELDRYLVVTRPGIWFTLIAIIVLMTGVFVWGFLGKLETTVRFPVEITENEALCFVPTDYQAKAEEIRTVKIGEKDYRLERTGRANMLDPTTGSEYVVYFIVKPNGEPFDGGAGQYDPAEMIEEISPITFILN